MKEQNIICLMGGLIIGLCLGFFAGYKKCEVEVVDAIIRGMVDYTNEQHQFVPPIEIPER